MTVPSWGTEAVLVSPGISKHRLLLWELRWAEGVVVGVAGSCGGTRGAAEQRTG